jgi:hypothetical protein
MHRARVVARLTAGTGCPSLEEVFQALGKSTSALDIGPVDRQPVREDGFSDDYWKGVEAGYTDGVAYTEEKYAERESVQRAR